MLEFRQCVECGTWFPRRGESCPCCGRFGLSIHELFVGKRLPTTGGLPLVAFVLAFFVPDAWSPAVVGAGFTPILAALTWLLWRRNRRDSTCLTERIDDVRGRLEELDEDLEDTDRRLEAARRDLKAERRPKASVMLEREVAQDRRLQAAQRRLVLQLERRLEQLEIERFRTQLRYFEACRDARIDSESLATDLDAAIQAVAQHAEAASWQGALEDARLLHRQLERGVGRLHAASRLDPLAYADITTSLPDALPPAETGELDEQTNHQLERIERSFEALEEIAAELVGDPDVGDPDASGVRLRVDDEVMAALEEAVLEEAIEGDRISAERL